MSLKTRKLVFRNCDQARLKPVCSTSETSQNLKGLKITSLAYTHILFRKQTTQGADQTAHMCMLVCSCLILKLQLSTRSFFLTRLKYELLEEVQKNRTF